MHFAHTWPGYFFFFFSYFPPFPLPSAHFLRSPLWFTQEAAREHAVLFIVLFYPLPSRRTVSRRVYLIFIFWKEKKTAGARAEGHNRMQNSGDLEGDPHFRSNESVPFHLTSERFYLSVTLIFFVFPDLLSSIRNLSRNHVSTRGFRYGVEWFFLSMPVTSPRVGNATSTRCFFPDSPIFCRAIVKWSKSTGPSLAGCIIMQKLTEPIIQAVSFFKLGNGFFFIPSFAWFSKDTDIILHGRCSLRMLIWSATEMQVDSRK